MFSIVKILRLFRLERHLETFSLYKRALSNSGSWLLANASAVVVVLALFSTILYYTERAYGYGEITEYVESIPSTMYLVMLMLCGEAPIIELSPAGKLVAVIVLIIGIVILSTIISLFTHHFQLAARENEEIRRKSKKRWKAAERIARKRTSRLRDFRRRNKERQLSRKYTFSQALKRFKSATSMRSASIKSSQQIR